MCALKKISEAEVASSDGFVVKYGRDTLTYSEGTRYVLIPIEHLGAPYEMSVSLNSIDKWMVKGRPAEDVGPLELDVIQSRVEECLTFLHRNFSVVR
ncbi:hypothetical protein ED236_12245 [Pseudomethylobacillus aquaticus]|uniref:Uncharacterized protein n=1 Tax=Pseudomethylobacillus aquaticus TaxID=2676064 RepID=A0A3N0UTC1_9PROT|nr:hypothetical protein ED236_12245 [Pseudomethylobacillus aquaticus]